MNIANNYRYRINDKYGSPYGDFNGEMYGEAPGYQGVFNTNPTAPSDGRMLGMISPTLDALNANQVQTPAYSPPGGGVMQPATAPAPEARGLDDKQKQNAQNALNMFAQEDPIGGMMRDSAGQMANERAAGDQFAVSRVQAKYGQPGRQVGEYAFMTDDLYREIDKGDYQLNNQMSKQEGARNVAGGAISGAGSGAALGSGFGAPGLIIGAAVGLLGGLFAGVGKNKSNRRESKARQDRMNRAYLDKLEEQRQKRTLAERELNRKNQEKVALRNEEREQQQAASIAGNVASQRSNVLGMANTAVNKAGLMGVNKPTRYGLA